MRSGNPPEIKIDFIKSSVSRAENNLDLLAEIILLQAGGLVVQEY